MPSLRTIILDAIKKEDEYNPDWTETESFRWLLNYALRSKSHTYKHHGAITALEDFFIGIGIHIPIWNEDIEKLDLGDKCYWTELALTVLREVD